MQLLQSSIREIEIKSQRDDTAVKHLSQQPDDLSFSPRTHIECKGDRELTLQSYPLAYTQVSWFT